MNRWMLCAGLLASTAASARDRGEPVGVIRLARLEQATTVFEAIAYIADSRRKVVLVPDRECFERTKKMKVAFVSNEPMSPEAEWEAFSSMLAVNGLEVEETERLVTVREAND